MIIRKQQQSAVRVKSAFSCLSSFLASHRPHWFSSSRMIVYISMWFWHYVGGFANTELIIPFWKVKVMTLGREKPEMGGVIHTRAFTLYLLQLPRSGPDSHRYTQLGRKRRFQVHYRLWICLPLISSMHSTSLHSINSPYWNKVHSDEDDTLEPRCCL